VADQGVCRWLLLLLLLLLLPLLLLSSPSLKALTRTPQHAQRAKKVHTEDGKKHDRSVLQNIVTSKPS